MRVLLPGLFVLLLTSCSESNDPVQESAAVDAQVARDTDNDMNTFSGPPLDTAMPASAGYSPPNTLPPAQSTVSTTRPFRHFEPAVILDATGFAQPMAAATLFIPHGWRTTGGVFWAQEFTCTNGYNFGWSATSPDGLTSMAVWPQTAWEANTSGTPSTRPGCPLLNINTVRGYLEGLVQQMVPGARALDFRERPDLLQALNSPPTRTAMPLGEVRTWSESGELLFGFQTQGREMRGTVAASVKFNLMVTDTSSMFQNDPTVVGINTSQYPTRSEFLSAFANPAFAAMAPDGQLDFNFFEGLRRSIRPVDTWTSAITGHNLRIGQVALEEGRKRAQMLNDSNAEIARIRQDTWNSQQESADKRAREFGETIRGVQSYVDPDAPGGTVEQSIQYDNVWRLNDGSYVLSDDPNFEPYRDLQLEGRKLEPVR